MKRLWNVGAWFAAAAVSVPLATVLWALVAPAGETWRHLRATVLADYAVNTVLLALSVGTFATVVGVGAAWTLATKDFPGRRFLSAALVLPLATPAYVVAYVYTDMLDYAGPVQTALRHVMDWQVGDYAFPAIRSLPGAALMLGLVLYPYVYVLARVAFASQAAPLAEAARTLGAGPRRAFFRVALPAARPAIAGGAALAMMETVADYGVVDYFGVATFTSGVFRTWFALGDRRDRDAARGMAVRGGGGAGAGRALRAPRPIRESVAARRRRARQASHRRGGVSRRALLAPCRCCWVSCCRPLFLAATP